MYVFVKIHRARHTNIHTQPPIVVVIVMIIIFQPSHPGIETFSSLHIHIQQHDRHNQQQYGTIIGSKTVV